MQKAIELPGLKAQDVQEHKRLWEDYDKHKSKKAWFDTILEEFSCYIVLHQNIMDTLIGYNEKFDYMIPDHAK